MAILFFILWVILNGRVTLEICIIGALITAAVWIFTVKVMGWDGNYEKMVLKNLPLMARFVVTLIREIIKSSVSVMKVVWLGKIKPDPVLVEFRSGLQTEFANVLLANSITLTPGTFTVFQEKDHFLVHCLVPEFAEGIEDSCFVRILSEIKE